jgi:hypothetical protein
MTGGCAAGHTNQVRAHRRRAADHDGDTLLYTPKTREELSYLIGIRPPSRGGGSGHGYCLNSPTMNWWTMEFVVVDVGATLVLLLGYLALMIRKAVL